MLLKVKEVGIVQCFTSSPTQYRLYERRFLQVKRPNQQYQSTEGKSTKENKNNKEVGKLLSFVMRCNQSPVWKDKIGTQTENQDSFCLGLILTLMVAVVGDFARQ